MKRVYCLYRVSTKGQVDKDDIPMQKTSCREFAEHNGWTILKEFQENGNREVHYANRSELFNNIIQTYCPQYFEQPVTNSDFDEASGEKKKKNENLKTSPNAEQTECEDIVDADEPTSAQQDEPTKEPENSSVEQNKNKQGKVVVRTERPPQGDNSNE